MFSKKKRSAVPESVQSNDSPLEPQPTTSNETALSEQQNAAARTQNKPSTMAIDPYNQTTDSRTMDSNRMTNGRPTMTTEQVNNHLAETSRSAPKPSIISEGFEFVGTIISQGTLNIAGAVKGSITAKAVLVDVDGKVEGELSAESLTIKGRLIGDVKCIELNVGPRAFVDGTIAYENINIQRGGTVAGKFVKNSA